MVSIQIAPCEGPERDTAIALLDGEFIHSRSRSVSLRERFAPVWASADSLLLAARSAHAIESLLLVRPFRCIAGGQTCRAAMVGLVWTRPESRGRGYGGALLRAAGERLAQQGYAFGALWSARPEFYARAGWIAADCGVLGRIRATASQPGPDQPIPLEAWSDIEALRSAEGSPRVERAPASYRMLLPPSDRIETICLSRSYAIVGRHGTRAYLLDCGGPADDSGLRNALRSRYAELWLNLRRDCPAHRALASEPSISWEAQRLACWLPLARGFDSSIFRNWYIPFFDRI